MPIKHNISFLFTFLLDPLYQPSFLASNYLTFITWSSLNYLHNHNVYIFICVYILINKYTVHVPDARCPTQYNSGLIPMLVLSILLYLLLQLTPPYHYDYTFVLPICTLDLPETTIKGVLRVLCSSLSRYHDRSSRMMPEMVFLL